MMVPNLNIDIISDIVVGVLICESLKYLLVKILTKIDHHHDTFLDIEER